jgi:hypothetical protein
MSTIGLQPDREQSSVVIDPHRDGASAAAIDLAPRG